ncbi:class I SAM-dependent methyltransferase [Lactobacillaceae bacterium L1_55_11]|nr:class I SAM-dependent methyltransferase [Lactobacillaceae bacterium L1_55_11]
MASQPNQNYTTFADLYDQLFDNQVYQEWLSFIQDRTQPEAVLDIGGGNGRLAVLLAQVGYQVTILDQSAAMLTLADRRASMAGVSVQILEGDMRDFSAWNQKYPLIVSTVDTLNYLPTEEDLAATLAQVYEHLDDGGRFLFDVITPYQVNVGYDQYYYNNDDDPDHIFMWTAFPGEEADSVDHDLKFFNYDESRDAFALLREVHHEQTYSLEVYQRLLKQAGFGEVAVWADFGQAEVGPETERWFFQAEKVKE